MAEDGFLVSSVTPHRAGGLFPGICVLQLMVLVLSSYSLSMMVTAAMANSTVKFWSVLRYLMLW